MNLGSRRSQLILFIIISYAYLWLLFGLGRLFEIPFSYDIHEPGGILVLFGVPSSLFAAGFVTLITRGSGGLRQLFRYTLAWRFSFKWYLFGLLTPLLVSFSCGFAAVWIDGIRMAENWFSPSMPLGFMTFLLIYIGLGEEIGWRGFALPRFQEILGSLGGSIATGVFWAFWHVPLFLMPGSSQYGHSIPLFVYLLTCWTVPMAVFVDKANGSVIPAILFHVAVNFLAFAILHPYKYFYIFWGITAVIAAPFLPRPLFRFGNRSVKIGMFAN
ncbi:CPBP family intramembrane glutamic endopeptidase [Desulfopila sp. IMCC35008]|uniref:CPBP family intramembrane glutamic endopeptidase n=1 Tax=Desulfopila sp. IMCC35008 TaxID=2653858 RepID=UPI0013D3BE3C|nr:type II CAAX endopeptidase family protein [Desulfopila sp. IMCC35008]